MSYEAEPLMTHYPSNRALKHVTLCGLPLKWARRPGPGREATCGSCTYAMHIASGHAYNGTPTWMIHQSFYGGSEL